MSRIRKAYEVRFRTLLQAAGARRLEEGVQRLVGKAQARSAQEGIPLEDALTRVYEDLAAQRRSVNGRSAAVDRPFFCDAGLGGLARWLRAAGYEAVWEAGIDDDVLIQKARDLPAIILTTDSMLMERKLLRDGIIPAYWLPPTLTIPEQLTLVFREFGLTVREARCMSCGGELRRESKEALRERIPPRTYCWLEEFFVCRRCGKLFWHGTHWERIRRQLSAFPPR